MHGVHFQLKKRCTPIVPNFKALVLPKRWGSKFSDRAPKIPNFLNISIKPLSQTPDMGIWIDFLTLCTKIVFSFPLNHFQKDSFCPTWAMAIFWPESRQNFFILIKNPFLTNQKSKTLNLKAMGEFMRQFWFRILLKRFFLLEIRKYRPKT